MHDALKDSKALAIPCSATAHLFCNEACGHSNLALPEVVQDMLCTCPVPHHKGCSLHSHRPMTCTCSRQRSQDANRQVFQISMAMLLAGDTPHQSDLSKLHSSSEQTAGQRAEVAQIRRSYHIT